MSEEVIIGVVLNTPKSLREYTEADHFKIQFFRNHNRHTLEITLWTHERQTTFFVYKAHSQRA